MPLARARATLWDIIRLMAPQPGRVELATRLALICALTVLVSEIYQTPEPALTVYIVFFLNRGDRTVSLIMNVVFLALITVIISFILLVAMVVINDPMWRVISMTAISFGLLFVASASKLRPLGGTVVLIIGYALDVLGTIQVGELGTRALLYAWLFVGIPAGLSMIVNLLLAPPPRRLAERAIALRLELAATMLEAPDDGSRHRFRECLRESTVEIRKQLHLADREKTSAPGDIAALQHAADSVTILMSAIDVMDRRPEAWLTVPLRDYLAHTLHEMSAILQDGGYPVRISWQPPGMDRPLTPLESDVLADIKEAITGFAEAPAREAHAEENREVHAEEKKEGSGFFEADAFTNPDYAHYALKTTGAAMFCYLLYSLLDWPGIHTCFITCYIVSLGTTAETVEKLTLRILGCLVGAAAGYAAIIFLLPYLTSITALMVLVFVGALASGYVAAGSPRISYAGFQIAFAFFLCVIQGPSPAFDLSVARDRVIGILIGNVVVYLLFTNLWPISVGKRIDPAIAALLRRLGAVMTTDARTRRALASQAQLALTEIQTDIELAGYEPSSVRPSPTWLAARRNAADEIGALGSPLLLSADREPAASVQIAERLETLAGRFVGSRTQPPTYESTAWSTSESRAWSTSPLFRIIDTGLRRLERASI
ncbi:MAG TPA: FUSC family protein [Xanthobacteraceae bacterium]|jgi:multidrug resistance protein MdtO